MLKTKFPKISAGKRKKRISRTGEWRLWAPILVVVVITAMLAPPVALSAQPPIQPASTDSGDSPFLWTVETVESNHIFYEMGPRSLGRDPSGNLHIAYGGDHLYYSMFNGTAWSAPAIIDSDPWVGQYTSMAIDGSGNIHVSYYDAQNGRLKYIKKTGGFWGAPQVLDTPTLAMNAAGSPDEEDTLQAYEVDTNLPPEEPTPTEPLGLPADKFWQEPTLEPESEMDLQESLAPNLYGDWGVGMYTAIALMSGQPHIIYRDAVNEKLKLAAYAGFGVWIIQTIRQTGTDNDEGKYAALAIDGYKRLHMTYLDDDHDDLRYTRCEDSNADYIYDRCSFLTIEDGDPGHNVGGYMSIALDSATKPHISYYDKTRGSLRYTYRTKMDSPDNDISKYWTTPTNVDDGPNGAGVGGWTSLILYNNESNSPYISYYDFSNQDLKYAWWDKKAGAWKKEKVVGTTEGDIGKYTSLMFDGANFTGRPHITYIDFEAGYLREVYKNASGRWSNTTANPPRNIDITQDVGGPSSLTLDAANRVHISYFNNTSDDIKYATNASGAWVTEVVSATGKAGPWNSIALDAGGNPHIAFYDSKNTNLRYTSKSGGVWSFVTLDRSKDKDVGIRPSLFMASGNVPHITYYNATDRDLKYATKPGASWITTTLSLPGDVGEYNGITGDIFGNLFVSFYDDKFGNEYTQDVRAYIWSAFDGFWVGPFPNVDYAGEVGRYNSVAVVPSLSNPNEVVFAQEKKNILANQNVDRDVRFARGSFTGSGWTFTNEAVEDGAVTDVGFYTSVAVNPVNGAPAVCYYDYKNKDLKFAYKPAGTWVIQVVDSDGDVGKYCSMKIDPTGVAHISYYDATNGELKYAHQAVLIAMPSNLTVMVDSDDLITQTSNIDTNLSPSVSMEWNAGTPGSWLYLGESGTSQTATGMTGEDLTVRMDPSSLSLGTYSATIEITGTNVITGSLETRLIKVDHIYRTFLPVILR